MITNPNPVSHFQMTGYLSLTLSGFFVQTWQHFFSSFLLRDAHDDLSVCGCVCVCVCALWQKPEGRFGVKFHSASSRICSRLEVLDSPQKYGLSPSSCSCVELLRNQSVTLCIFVHWVWNLKQLNIFGHTYFSYENENI